MFVCMSVMPDAPFPGHSPLRGRKGDKSCERGDMLGVASMIARVLTAVPSPLLSQAWLKELSISQSH